MHPRVNAAFERICRGFGTPGAVLEVGATPSADTLLNLPALASAARRIGVNMEGASRIGDAEILYVNANAMPMFEDGAFDLVVCNSMLEHDAKFWLTLGEIRRVLRPGGHAVLGVPGYVEGPDFWQRLRGRAAWLWRPPLPGAAWLAGSAAAAPVLQVHNFPGDYYRFSQQAMREVLLEGFEVISIDAILHPPRLIGVGQRHG